MPPRHAYWTIIVDDQPTSFRAHDVEELLPTFNRLREKNPTAQLKWFERGKLWDTRDAARVEGFGKGERRWEGPRPDRDGTGEQPRDRAWRPGGEHRDPRQKYKDASKEKWQHFKQHLRTRWEEKQRSGGPLGPPERKPRDAALPPPRPDRGDHTPPHGDPLRPKVARRNIGAPAAMRPEHREKTGRGPRQEWRRNDRPRDDRPEFRPDDDRRGARPPRREDNRRDSWRPREGDRGDKKPWGQKPGGARKAWGKKPGGPPRGESSGARKPWAPKSSGGPKKPYRSDSSRPPRANSRGPHGPKKRRDDKE